MPTLDEIAKTAVNPTAEYDATGHIVSLPSIEAAEVTVELVLDRYDRLQARLALHGIDEKPQLDAEGNPILDENGDPVLVPVDVIHYLAGTWSEWQRIEAALDPALASQCRDAIGLLWSSTK